MRIQKSVEINAPPEKVWPFLVEPEKILGWCTTFKKFEYTTEQRSGEGTPIYVEEKAGGPLMKIHFTVTEWVENEKLAFRMTSGTGVKSYEIESTLESTPSGSKYTFMEEFKLPYSIIGKALEAIGKGVAVGHIKEAVANLKSLAEA